MINEHRIRAIVLAGGRGNRFGAAKQFAKIRGRSLAEQAVVAAQRWAPVTLVLPRGSTWRGPTVERVVTGGKTRTESVRAALRDLPSSTEIIVVHDAAHPIASPRLFESVIRAVEEGADGAVPGLPIVETLGRTRGGSIAETVERGLVAMQMPQAFRAPVLIAAHREVSAAVDDASILVAQGSVVVVVDGDPANLHVISPADLGVAEVIAQGADAT